MSKPDELVGAEIKALADCVLAIYKGHPVWLILAAHLACLLAVDDSVAGVRVALLGHLRDTVRVFEDLGDARGAEAVEILRAHAYLFEGMSSEQPLGATVH